MLVVSDTSPLCYLVLIGEINLLEQIYHQVIIPEIVRDELLHPDAPEPVRQWVSQLPSWVTIRTSSGQPDTSLMKLDPGERSAILLAENIGADLVLIDERRGRNLATSRGLKVTGLVGVLDTAAELRFINLQEVLFKLQKTDFWVSPKILANLEAKHQHNSQ
jgi:predicted nucleic acid-binding protein